MLVLLLALVEALAKVGGVGPAAARTRDSWRLVAGLGGGGLLKVGQHPLAQVDGVGPVNPLLLAAGYLR